MVAVAAHAEALLVGEAGLLDIHIDIPYGADDSQGFVGQPAGIGVRNQPVPCVQHLGYGANAFNVRIGTESDFQLEAGIAFRSIRSHVPCHGLGFLA